MLLAYFLFGCFKQDVCYDVIPEGANPTTVRRKVIDIAATLIPLSSRCLKPYGTGLISGLFGAAVRRRHGSILRKGC